MISPAYADLQGTGTVISAYSSSGSPNKTESITITYPAAGVVGSSKRTSLRQALASISVDNSVTFDTAVGFYVSYYFRTEGGQIPAVVGTPYSTSNYTGYYYNQNNVRGTASVEVTTFTPASQSGYYNAEGATLKVNYVASSEAPIKGLSITSNYASNYFTQTNAFYMYPYITSAKLVEVTSSAELEGLQNIANQIAGQNDILNAMYGDIMEVLNAIYSRLGDMQETMNLANSYFNSMVNYLNSINTNTAQIYSLLQSQFQLLIAAINTASSDIQGAISKQTEDLKTYFDSVFNSAVGTLPDDTDSAQGVIDDAHENDEQYTADALGKFEEISATFQGFDGSVGSGVAVASTLFSRVWTAMGDYVIVYTFPLTLALALVIVGRLSRVHSKDSSKNKGGDDSG